LEFSEAIEEGTDVAPAVLREQLELFSEHRVAVLAYNEQTTGATTEQVLAAAKKAGVPVVGVRETLPDGQDYLQWMQADLAAMKAALG
jgi:zinc/manganese transport system substrate-binding protein